MDRRLGSLGLRHRPPGLRSGCPRAPYRPEQQQGGQDRRRSPPSLAIRITFRRTPPPPTVPVIARAGKEADGCSPGGVGRSACQQREKRPELDLGLGELGGGVTVGDGRGRDRRAGEAQGRGRHPDRGGHPPPQRPAPSGRFRVHQWKTAALDSRVLVLRAEGEIVEEVGPAYRAWEEAGKPEPTAAEIAEW